MIGLFKRMQCLGFGVMVLCSLTAWSDNKAVPEMSKDSWLKQVKSVVSEPICKGFMKDESIARRFKALNMSFEDCVAKIPPLAEQCQQKYYKAIPEHINQTNASKWGRTIGECIGTEFARQYLYKTGE